MKVNLAKSAGFCFGVRRALRIADETAARGGKVFMLGEIVHNEDVLRDIERKGIRRIRRLSRGGGSRTLLICAHGVPSGLMQRARSLHYRVVDATCPMVKHIHRIASDMEREGRRVIVIGDKDHDEVRGIVGQLRTEAIVIDSVADIQASIMGGIKKAAVVVQSTQDIGKVLKIKKKIQGLVHDLRFHNTICKPTSQKQREILSLAVRNDVVVIIGSRTSANTRRLYELSRLLNPRTHWVGSKDDLKPCWLRNAKRVAVGAGASTPESVTAGVIGLLLTLGKRRAGMSGKAKKGRSIARKPASRT